MRGGAVHKKFLRDNSRSFINSNRNHSKRYNQSPHKSVNINAITNSPSSTLVKIQDRRVRLLVDTGAQASVLHKRVFDELNPRPRLYSCSTSLATASGDALKVIGKSSVVIFIAKQRLTHEFIIVKNLNRNGILGRDFLVKNKARIFFDLSIIKINSSFQPLESDIHMSSLTRSNRDVVLKPYSIQLLTCNTRHRDCGPYTINELTRGHLADEPGVAIINSISAFRQRKRLPVLLSNMTGRYVKIKRGSVLGKIEACNVQVNEKNQATTAEKGNNTFPELNFNELQVSDEHRSSIEKLIKINRDVFAANNRELGHCKTLPVKIELQPGVKPIKQRAYKMPLKYKAAIDKGIDELLEANIIRRTQSEWASPIVVVKKNDDSLRMCLDLRKVNGVIKHSTYPIPRIDQVLMLLNGAKYFTSLDLFSGYHQQELEEESRKICAFTSHRGLFQFNRLPFGIQVGSSHFQSLMDIVLQGTEEFALAYLDDILIFSKTKEDHVRHIQEVFNRLRQHNLKLKMKKCSFMEPETQYLGFVINAGGIKVDPNKVKIIRDLPTPKTVKEIRSVLGMAGFYRKIIPNFSRIAEPLINLTKKYAKFKWEPIHQVAFDELKRSLTKIPSLGHPDPEKKYRLYTDASDTTIGCVLCQEASDDANPELQVEKPICFMSHKLSNSQVRYSTIEKEMYAIHYFVQKLDSYLNGAEFEILSDHQPLKYALSSPMANKRLQLWSINLASYNCKILYIKGKDNGCADLLSRHPLATNDLDSEDERRIESHPIDEFMEINVLNSNRFEPKQFMDYQAKEVDGELQRPNLEEFQDIDMKVEQDKDQSIRQLRAKLLEGNTEAHGSKNFILIDEIVYFLSHPEGDVRVRMYIPEHFRVDIIARFHTDLSHAGMDSIYDVISRKYYWPNLYKEIQEYNKACLICQERSKKVNKHPTELMDTPPYPFAVISIDMCGPFVESYAKNRYAFTIIDEYSRYPEIFPVADKSAETIIHILLDEIIPRYGCPLKVKSDNGLEFKNSALEYTLKALNIEHVYTTNYNPQQNGILERSHRVLNDAIAKQVSQDNRLWDVFINQTLSAMRCCKNESTGESPYYLLFKREAVMPVDNILRPRRKYVGEDLHRITLEKMHREFRKVHTKMKKSRLRQQRYANVGAKPVEYKIGDPVFVRKFGRKNKLQGHWEPYYRITEQISPISFEIRNQLDNSVRKVQARHLKMANTDADWGLKPQTGERPLRKAAMAAPSESSSSESEFEEEDNVPLAQLIKRKRTTFSSSESDEDNMPLSVLAKRLRGNFPGEAGGATEIDPVRKAEEGSESLTEETAGSSIGEEPRPETESADEEMVYQIEEPALNPQKSDNISDQVTNIPLKSICSDTQVSLTCNNASGQQVINSQSQGQPATLHLGEGTVAGTGADNLKQLLMALARVL